MDTLLRRLKYYGIGFGIGLIFVIFLFQQKGCSWTPGNRVKSAIFERIVFVDSIDQAYLKQNNINANHLREFIENATISFLKSKRNGKEKIYHFSGELKHKFKTILIAYREKSVVVDLDFKNRDIKAYKPLIGKAYPFLWKDKNWFSGKWNLYPIKGMVASIAPEKITKLFFKNGFLDCDKSTLNSSEPIAYFELQNRYAPSQVQYIRIKSNWFQEKIDIKDLKCLEAKGNN